MDTDKHWQNMIGVTTITHWTRDFRLLHTTAGQFQQGFAGMRPWEFTNDPSEILNMRQKWLDCQISQLPTVLENIAFGVLWVSIIYPLQIPIGDSAFTCVSSPMPNLHKLTPRERQIIDLLGTCCSVKAVASQAGISSGTAKTHCRRIMLKLSIGCQSDLAAYAAVLASRRAV